MARSIFVLMGEMVGDYGDHYQRQYDALAASPDMELLERHWQQLPHCPTKEFPDARQAVSVTDGCTVTLTYVHHHYDEVFLLE